MVGFDSGDLKTYRFDENSIFDFLGHYNTSLTLRKDNCMSWAIFRHLKGKNIFIAGILFSYFLKVSSEPAVFLYSVAIGIYGAVFPNFIRQKFCNPDAEPAFDYLCNDTGPLLEATDLTTTRNTLREFVPVLVLLLAGSWRDATGKNKPLMCSALIGEVVGVLIELLAVWNWSISPWIPSVVASVLYGLSGGSKLFYVGATCAITDQSSTEDRTTRYAIYQTAAYTGSCLASLISGYCLQYLGYRCLFMLVISLFLLTFTFVINIKQDGKENRKNGEIEILQKMKAVCKPRSNNLIIWLMLISCIIINVSSSAEKNLYLYFLQQGFDFTVREAGVYLAFRLMFGVVSIMILSPVFTKILKWSDFRIGIISTAVTLISNTSMFFAKTTLQLIIFALLDFLKIFVFTLPMAVVTKCVKSDEVGVFVSLRFIGGCLSPIVIFYIYDFIFSATSQTKPGAFFLASAAITLLVLVCFCLSPCIYETPDDEPMEKNSITNDIEKNAFSLSPCIYETPDDEPMEKNSITNDIEKNAFSLSPCIYETPDDEPMEKNSITNDIEKNDLSEKTRCLKKSREAIEQETQY